MQWNDEGYLLSKNNYDENSIIIETFTLEHGKCAGIVYGGSSRKQKKIFQAGNKILLVSNDGINRCQHITDCKFNCTCHRKNFCLSSGWTYQL